MQSIQMRRKHPDMAGQQALMGEGNQGGVKKTGHRHVCLIHAREPLREGFNEVGSYTKLLSNVIEVGDVGGETTGRGRAVRDATLDRNAAATDAASVTRRRGCRRASQVAVGGVDGRSERVLRVSIDEIRESSNLELSEG